jgi:demethylmenaquinone methyltransferase / 2-methoxy-6-polyprenyl-1,4-benzoquinol methylase
MRRWRRSHPAATVTEIDENSRCGITPHGRRDDCATNNTNNRRGNSAMSKTHFGYETVDEQDKAKKVAGVFHSVASNYDLMNDLMSGGLHRIWKHFTIGQAKVRPGYKVLDLAGGTGDLAMAFAKQAGESGEVWHTDINESMLRVGRDRLIDKGVMTPALLCDAEKIPFPDGYFNIITVAFGLRNMTHKDSALAEMCRVLKPGGKLLVLEFSKVWEPLKKPYDIYSFKILPWLGEKVAKDADSYRYLAESIRMHPDQETLKTMMEQAGLDRVEYYNLSGGVVALHVGTKF